jgi:hypothetical protein
MMKFPILFIMALTLFKPSYGYSKNWTWEAFEIIGQKVFQKLRSNHLFPLKQALSL